MIVVDIGNTNIVFGVYYNNRLTKVFRYETRNKKVVQLISNQFTNWYIKRTKIKKKICIFSSVVPEINNKIQKIFKLIQFKVFNISPSKIPFNIKFKYKKNELGCDRIANTIAAINKYGKNCLIIDFGTATTFDVIKNNIYDGGIIAPGIRLSHDALITNTSKLKKISIVKTKTIVGKTTTESMQSGFYWGYISLINGIIEKILYEKKYKPIIILTGGLAITFKDKIIKKNKYEPYLTLEGLKLIGQANYA